MILADITTEKRLEILAVAKTLGIIPFMDGDSWCALWGTDLMRGIAGFGNTPFEALYHLYNEIFTPKNN